MEKNGKGLSVEEIAILVEAVEAAKRQTEETLPMAILPAVETIIYAQICGYQQEILRLQEENRKLRGLFETLN